MKEFENEYFVDYSIKPDGLVVYCSDPFWRIALDQFIKNELGFKHPVEIKLGGSVHPFGSLHVHEFNYKALWYQIRFFIDEMKLGRAAFINHELCKWYAHHGDGHAKRKELQDLVAVAMQVSSAFTRVKVEGYLGTIIEKTGNRAKVRFRQFI